MPQLIADLFSIVPPSSDALHHVLHAPFSDGMWGASGSSVTLTFLNEDTSETTVATLMRVNLMLPSQVPVGRHILCRSNTPRYEMFQTIAKGCDAAVSLILCCFCGSPSAIASPTCLWLTERCLCQSMCVRARARARVCSSSARHSECKQVLRTATWHDIDPLGSSLGSLMFRLARRALLGICCAYLDTYRYS